MKFRYKVLIINIILLSVGIGTVGYFMIDRNEHLAMDAQIKNAIDENNMLQSSIEYQLLGVADKQTQAVANTLATVCPNIILGVSANQSDIYILYKDSTVYSNAGYVPDSVGQLAAACEMGQKNYIFTEENGEHYISTTSCSVIAGANLNIINRRNITDAYRLMEKQLAYFRLLLIIVICFCSLLMFIFSALLTKPLEKLNELSEAFAGGDYRARVDIHSADEVGELAKTYNHMAQAVEEHVEELQDMVERQDRFVADFTHEIKTPMTAIIGYADTIRSKELTRENQIIAASYIFSEGKRLETMSMKLFDLLCTKQQKIRKNKFWSGHLMEEVAKSVEPSLAAHGITLSVSVDNESLFGDIDLLKSSFINLIDNARKASKEDGKIIFSGMLTDNGYRFTVQDFGVGISKEHLSHITDAFYMVDKSRSRKEGGAGLGLSLANLVFQCHDADFHIESTVGEGTVITVTLPTEDADIRESQNTDADADTQKKSDGKNDTDMQEEPK